LHPDSSELQEYLRSLKEIDFELAYLAMLTREGIKPLSRWEKPLADEGLELLQRVGLLTKQVRRTVKTGKEFIETIFSRTPAYLRLYEQTFGNTPDRQIPPNSAVRGLPLRLPALLRKPLYTQALRPK